MNNKVLILAMVSILFLAMSSVAQEVATLSITATNFKNENGQAVVNLFREQDDLPKKPFMTS